MYFFIYLKLPCKTFLKGVKYVRGGEFKCLQLTTQDEELSATFL